MATTTSTATPVETTSRHIRNSDCVKLPTVQMLMNLHKKKTIIPIIIYGSRRKLKLITHFLDENSSKKFRFFFHGGFDGAHSIYNGCKVRAV